MVLATLCYVAESLDASPTDLLSSSLLPTLQYIKKPGRRNLEISNFRESPPVDDGPTDGSEPDSHRTGNRHGTLGHLPGKGCGLGHLAHARRFCCRGSVASLHGVGPGPEY